MGLRWQNRVKETTSVIGTGPAALLGSANFQVPGSPYFRSFSAAGFQSGDFCYYCIEDSFGPNWEVGYGQLLTTGSSSSSGSQGGSGFTLLRLIVEESTNNNQLVSFTQGAKNVFCDLDSGNVQNLFAGGLAGQIWSSAGQGAPSGWTSTVNGLTITTTTGTFALANGKTLTVDNSLELAGTDSTKMTFPSTSATIARTDTGQTFTGNQAVTGTVAITSPSASAFSVGPNGANSPTLNVDASATSAVTGLDVVAAAAGGGVTLKAASSGTNESLILQQLGTSPIVIRKSGGVAGTDEFQFSQSSTTALIQGKQSNQRLQLQAPPSGSLLLASNSVNVSLDGTPFNVRLGSSTDLGWTGSSAVTPGDSYVSYFAPISGGGVSINRTAASSGSPSVLTVNVATDLTLTAGTNAPNINLVGGTRQFTSGSWGSNYYSSVLLQPDTLTATGATTIPIATTLYASAPISGTNLSITNPLVAYFKGNVWLNNGSTATNLRLYDKDDGAGNTEWLDVSFVGGTTWQVSPSTTGTGTARNLYLGPSNNIQIFAVTGVINLGSYFQIASSAYGGFWNIDGSACLATGGDNQYDIGKASHRPRDLNIGRDANLGGALSVGAGAATISSTGYPKFAGSNYLTADVTNATATLANINTLANCISGVTYSGIIAVPANDSQATEGLKFSFAGTATFSAVDFGFIGVPLGATLGTAYSTSFGTAITVTTATTADVQYFIAFSGICNGSGTLILQGAQVSHTLGTATFRAGSFGQIQASF